MRKLLLLVGCCACAACGGGGGSGTDAVTAAQNSYNQFGTIVEACIPDVGAQVARATVTLCDPCPGGSGSVSRDDQSGELTFAECTSSDGSFYSGTATFDQEEGTVSANFQPFGTCSSAEATELATTGCSGIIEMVCAATNLTCEIVEGAEEGAACQATCQTGGLTPAQEARLAGTAITEIVAACTASFNEGQECDCPGGGTATLNQETSTVTMNACSTSGGTTFAGTAGYNDDNTMDLDFTQFGSCTSATGDSVRTDPLESCAGQMTAICSGTEVTCSFSPPTAESATICAITCS